jgi:hypothetical protein
MEVMYPHLQRSARLLYGPDGGVSAVGTRIFEALSAGKSPASNKRRCFSAAKTSLANYFVINGVVFSNRSPGSGTCSSDCCPESC